MRTLDIIRYFNPQMWWIENPRYGKLKEQGILEGVAVLDVDYCQFSDWGYKKPTRIWGSPQLFSSPQSYVGHIVLTSTPKLTVTKLLLGGPIWNTPRGTRVECHLILSNTLSQPNHLST